MAVLAGFGWTIGFILFLLPDNEEGFKRFLVSTIKYLFILLNATPGLFIFAVYVCNRRVFSLYRQLLTQIYEFFRFNFGKFKKFMLTHTQVCLNKTKDKLEKLNNVRHKQKQDDTPLKTITMPTSTKSSEISKHTTFTHLLCQPQGRSSQITATYQTLNTPSLDEQSSEIAESNS